MLDPNGVGRSSVRIESKKTYTKGLFIADIQHMPDSVCGVWPAFWTVGNNWPSGGEIGRNSFCRYVCTMLELTLSLDIIEGINQNTQNQMVLHTNGQCTINNSGMTGSVLSDNCQIAHSTTGCSVQGTDGSLGSPFNEAQGGVLVSPGSNVGRRLLRRVLHPGTPWSGPTSSSASGSSPVALSRRASRMASRTRPPSVLPWATSRDPATSATNSRSRSSSSTPRSAVTGLVVSTAALAAR